MMPVIIDTNVSVSALLFGGTPGKIVPLWKSGRIQPHITSEIVDELLRVLAYPKFKLTEKEIQYLLYVEILPYCKVVTVKSGTAIIEEDPSDDIFLRCCEVAEAEALISGDRHLLNLKSHGNTKILAPSRFLKEYRESFFE